MAKEKNPGHRFKPGNQIGRLAHNGRPDFITQQLIAALNDPPNKADMVKDPAIKTRYAAMVDKLVSIAIREGSHWAFEFIFNRVEGPMEARAKVEHKFLLEQVLPLLDDSQLGVMEEVARKALVLEAKAADII